MRIGIVLEVVCLSLLALTALADIGPLKEYPVSSNGAEVININGPNLVLAYISNLRLDETLKTLPIQTLHFLSDRGQFNIYTAQFTLNGGDQSFWANEVSPLQGGQVGPFLSFDILKNNTIGIALPNIFTPSVGAFIQSVYNSPTGVKVSYLTAPGITFVSTYISQALEPLTGRNYVYFAGWNTDTASNRGAFVVARGAVFLGIDTPEVIVKWNQDVLDVKMPVACYDQFGDKSRPQMTLDVSGKNLILIIPGRCATFAKIIIPTDPTFPFSIADVEVFNPKTTSTYVSSAVYDFTYQTIYYTLKTYQSITATLLSVDTSSTMKQTNLSISLDLLESEAVTVLASETIDTKVWRWIFVFGSGSNKVLRLLFDGTKYISSFSGVLDPTINQVSSAVYFDPWLFFTTYEPDAKIVRMLKTNFCETYCGDSGYCLHGSCLCRAGFQFDPMHPAEGCVSSALVVAEQQEKHNADTTVALGILFGIALATAIAGWGLWWRNRSSVYSSLN